MTDGKADELLLKVGVKVDDSEYINLKSDLKKNREESINLKVKPDERIFSANQDAIRERLDNKSNIQSKPSISEKDILQSNMKDSKKFLTDIINSKEDESKLSISKDKASEYLSKILDVEKKSANSLENLLNQEMDTKQENKKSVQGDSIGGMGIAGIVAGVVGALFYAQKQVLNAYTEKLSRELDIANLAAATGDTANNMTKLNYQAKNVGLSLEQVVHSATNFADDIFSGNNLEKMGMFAAMGKNPILDMKNIKTPEDAVKYQTKIFEDFKKGMMRGGFPEFVASKRAAGLAGIPENQILGYENFESKKNRGLALETKSLRGDVGSGQSIMGNFQDITSKLQDSTAVTDKLLSRGDIAKKISLQSAEITATTVNLINATLDFTGLADKNSKFSQIMGSQKGNQFILPDFSSSKKSPSAAAQAKSGGNN